MKKILFAMLFAVGLLTAFQSDAQVALVSPTYGNTIDTVTNAGVKTLYTKVNGNRATVTITVNITKISGTLGGTLIPVASNDGVNFYDITGFTTQDAAFTVTDVVSQGKAYQCKLGYQYYGVRWTGTGTMSGSFTATLIARKPNE